MGPSADRTGPHWLFFNLSLWTVRRPSLLSPTFHFMSALAGTLTSSSSFFIMFVSGCAVLSGKALVSRKKPSQDQRETQPGVTQTGRERGGGREVWGKGRERDWDRDEERESRPGVAQTVREEKEMTEVAIEGAITKTQLALTIKLYKWYDFSTTRFATQATYRLLCLLGL